MRQGAWPRRSPHWWRRGSIFRSCSARVVWRNPARGLFISVAGFVKSDDAHGLRVVARDQPRLLQRLTSELAAAGINLRSVSASVIKARCVMIFAFDAASDRDKAAQLLGK